MKQTLSILFLVTLFMSCSTELEKKVIGTWISSHETNILRQIEDDLVEIESMPIDSSYVESPVDTTHYVLVSILDFTSSGKFSLIHTDTIQGDWIIKENIIILQADSIQATATIDSDKMVLEFNLDDLEVFHYYEKINEPNRSAIERADYLDRCWEVRLNDSSKLIYNFIDTTYVIITSDFGTDWGYWYNFNSKGIQSINTFNLDLAVQTSTFVFEESGKSKTTQEIPFYIPETHESVLTEIFPLSSENFQSLKGQLMGKWINMEDFYPKDSLIDDERRLIDFEYSLEFKDSVFVMKYSGKDNKTMNSIERKIKGSWQLDKFGNYITLKYKAVFRNEEINHTRFMTLYSLNEDEMEMTLEFISLISEMNYSGTRIKMIKE